MKSIISKSNRCVKFYSKVRQLQFAKLAKECKNSNKQIYNLKNFGNKLNIPKEKIEDAIRKIKAKDERRNRVMVRDEDDQNNQKQNEQNKYPRTSRIFNRDIKIDISDDEQSVKIKMNFNKHWYQSFLILLHIEFWENQQQAYKSNWCKKTK